MTEIYSAGDYDAVVKQKKRSLVLFFTILGIYIAASVAIFVYFLFEPYGTPKRPWLLLSECVITGLFVIFAYVYLSIKFKKVRRYCIFLERILNREPTSGEATFMRFNSEVTVKDGVDLSSMTLVEWSEKEKDYMERRVMLDCEKPLPDFRAGDMIKFNTYSNVLSSYDIVNRTVLKDSPFGSDFE